MKRFLASLVVFAGALGQVMVLAAIPVEIRNQYLGAGAAAWGALLGLFGLLTIGCWLLWSGVEELLRDGFAWPADRFERR